MKPTDAWVFLLPPGWARFPIGDGREQELDAAIDEVVARALPGDLPRDSAEPLRRMSRERLRSSLRSAGDEGASAVYLPIAPADGVLVPASIVELEFTSDPGSDPADVVAEVLLADFDEREVLEIDGRPAARIAVLQRDVDQGEGLPPLTTRQIVYAISRDDLGGEWLALSFTVIANSDGSERLAEALVLFFDAVMTTFRWAGDENSQDRPTVPGSARSDARAAR